MKCIFLIELFLVDGDALKEETLTREIELESYPIEGTMVFPTEDMDALDVIRVIYGIDDNTYNVFLETQRFDEDSEAEYMKMLSQLRENGWK